jgi:hypothetical protein
VYEAAMTLFLAKFSGIAGFRVKRDEPLPHVSVAVGGMYACMCCTHVLHAAASEACGTYRGCATNHKRREGDAMFGVIPTPVSVLGFLQVFQLTSRPLPLCRSLAG